MLGATGESRPRLSRLASSHARRVRETTPLGASIIGLLISISVHLSSGVVPYWACDLRRALQLYLALDRSPHLHLEASLSICISSRSRHLAHSPGRQRKLRLTDSPLPQPTATVTTTATVQPSRDSRRRRLLARPTQQVLSSRGSLRASPSSCARPRGASGISTGTLRELARLRARTVPTARSARPPGTASPTRSSSTRRARPTSPSVAPSGSKGSRTSWTP